MSYFCSTPPPRKVLETTSIEVDFVVVQVCSPNHALILRTLKVYGIASNSYRLYFVWLFSVRSVICCLTRSPHRATLHQPGERFRLSDGPRGLRQKRVRSQRSEIFFFSNVPRCGGRILTHLCCLRPPALKLFAYFAFLAWRSPSQESYGLRR